MGSAHAGLEDLPFQSPTGLADGLGLESGLDAGYPASFAPSPDCSEDFGSPAPGFRKEASCLTCGSLSYSLCWRCCSSCDERLALSAPAIASQLLQLAIALALAPLLVGWVNPGVYGPTSVYVAELHPTHLRATAVGWFFGIGRIGSFLAPSVVGFMLAYGLGGWTLYTFALSYLIASFAPFNNLPTQYRISIDGQHKWFAQCGLESLAMSWLFPETPLVVDAPCLDCGDPIRVTVRKGVIEREEPRGICFYVDVPAREWRANLPFA